MALKLEDIEPAAAAETAPPAETPAETKGAVDTDAEIPDEILEIPAFAGLLAGKPAAVWNEVGRADPVGALIVENQEALKSAGFGFYGSTDKKTSVLFNSEFISGDELKKADADGTLREVAVPLQELLSSYESVIGEGGGGAAEGLPPMAAPGPVANPAPAGVQTRLGSARLRNLATGGPTSGPSPGAGRLQNSLQKNVI